MRKRMRNFTTLMTGSEGLCLIGTHQRDFHEEVGLQWADDSAMPNGCYAVSRYGLCLVVFQCTRHKELSSRSSTPAVTTIGCENWLCHESLGNPGGGASILKYVSPKKAQQRYICDYLLGGSLGPPWGAFGPRAPKT